MLVALTDHWVCMHHSDELALASWCVFICTVVLACPCGLSHDDGDAHIVSSWHQQPALAAAASCFAAICRAAA